MVSLMAETRQDERDEGRRDAADVDATWCFVLDGFDPEQERAREALLALADGRVGMSGTTLADHPGARRWTIAIGLYAAEGPETHLLPGPVSMHLPHRIAPGAPLRRVLDLRRGVLQEDFEVDDGAVRTLRFAALARPGLSVLRAEVPTRPTGPLLVPSTDGAIAEEGHHEGVAWASSTADGTDGGMTVAATELVTHGADGWVVDRFIAHDADPDARPGPETAGRRAREAAADGFDVLLAEQQAAWAARWEDADITLDGDDALQLAIRYSLFHLMASVPDTGEAAVGARGLTGEGYRGHVFWDADTFTLPFLAATHPAAARAMLEYRLRRLPTALENARAQRRAGARFPWESARSGLDVTPRSARDRTGKVVPIRTGLLEDHIVAQVPWAAATYAAWSGDEELERGPGRQLLVETARYWQVRARRDADGTAHIYGVIGPDEYHEPVDDNAFTNVMARWNLRRAADAVEHVPTGDPVVGADEIVAWRELADALVDGFDPDTGIYEEFAGFNRLEPLVIEEVAPRRPIAADLLLGADRVHGAQVVKQADVLMLHHLVPSEVEEGTLESNLRFYEPRTAHGSSLSPAIHASLFARTRNYDRALGALRIAARLDLDDLTGSTAGGLHLATMGSVWQALTFGFAGLRPRDGRLEVDPRLPPAWGALEVRVRYRGSRVVVRITRSHLTILADPLAPVRVAGRPYTAGPGGLELMRRGSSWEAIS